MNILHAMKRGLPVYFAVALLGSTGCKSLQHVSSKDNSMTQTRPAKQSQGNSVFLDNISVTPGGKQTSQMSPIKKNTVSVIAKPAGGFDIESASGLQIKYATMLDVPIESLTNGTLLQDIDYWWGTKYCLGGSTETCIDCSSFTQNIMRDVYGKEIPRTASEQFQSSSHIDRSDLQQGDLVFFQTGRKGISHVGVYIANNKFAHASVSNGVMISDLDESYWHARYRGAGRF